PGFLGGTYVPTPGRVDRPQWLWQPDRSAVAHANVQIFQPADEPRMNRCRATAGFRALDPGPNPMDSMVNRWLLDPAFPHGTPGISRTGEDGYPRLAGSIEHRAGFGNEDDFKPGGWHAFCFMRGIAFDRIAFRIPSCRGRRAMAAGSRASRLVRDDRQRVGACRGCSAVRRWGGGPRRSPRGGRADIPLELGRAMHGRMRRKDS